MAGAGAGGGLPGRGGNQAGPGAALSACGCVRGQELAGAGAGGGGQGRGGTKLDQMQRCLHVGVGMGQKVAGAGRQEGPVRGQICRKGRHYEGTEEGQAWPGAALLACGSGRGHGGWQVGGCRGECQEQCCQHVGLAWGAAGSGIDEKGEEGINAREG